MKPYIYGERNGIHIIDLRQTLEQIESAVSYIKDVTAKGGHIALRRDEEAGPITDRRCGQRRRDALRQLSLARGHAHQLRHHPKANLLHEGARTHGVVGGQRTLQA